MFDELFSRFHEWYWRKHYAFRWFIHFGLYLFLRQILSLHFEGEFTITIGELVGLIVGSAFSATIRPNDPPERPAYRPKPEGMSLVTFSSQKVGRYLIAALLISFVAWISDPVIQGDSSFGSKAHLTFLVIFIWPVGANLPFWQPNQSPRPKKEQLPPWPPSLQAPDHLA